PTDAVATRSLPPERTRLIGPAATPTAADVTGSRDGPGSEPRPRVVQGVLQSPLILVVIPERERAARALAQPLGAHPHQADRIPARNLFQQPDRGLADAPAHLGRLGQGGRAAERGEVREADLDRDGAGLPARCTQT